MAESRIKDENFYQVQGWMINRLGLKGIQLSVYAIIYGFTQDGENEFTGSLQYLCDFTGGTSKPTIIKALKELVENGYLIRRENVINGVQFNAYRANLPLLKNFNGGSKEILPGGSKEILMGGSKETLPNTTIKDNKSLEIKEDIITIVRYLNAKAGKSYRADNKMTQKHINARLAEGYTVADFITVIDKKCAQWLGTDMEQYLRPDTLFGTKFDIYLNAPAETQRRPSSGNAFLDLAVEEGAFGGGY